LIKALRQLCLTRVLDHYHWHFSYLHLSTVLHIDEEPGDFTRLDYQSMIWTKIEKYRRSITSGQYMALGCVAMRVYLTLQTDLDRIDEGVATAARQKILYNVLLALVNTRLVLDMLNGFIY
jgi:hypothetical protein